MTILGMILLLCLLFPFPVWSTDIPLFIIQRSKNTNEVQYQLRVDDRCHIASEQPVSAFWKLLEAHPEKTASLSVFDQLAYGVVQQTVADNWVSFSLKALEQKRLKAHASATPQAGTCAAIVHTDINGHVATLERIYVQTEEGFLKPKVVYIDLFGKSTEATPTPVQERITP